MGGVGGTSSIVGGVTEVAFRITVAGQSVPCVLWKPVSNTESRTLIAMGHGGGQHKKSAVILNRAAHYARAYGWASLAIDAPGHGERISTMEAETERCKTDARVRGDVDAPSTSIGLQLPR